MRRLAIAAVGLSMALAVGVAAQAGAESRAARPVHTTPHGGSAGGWTPKFRSARRYARGRTGDVRFAVIDQFGRMQQLNGARTAPMASTFKALLLATYLSRPSVRNRGLHGWERDLLGPMIRSSNNDAATRVRNILGAGPITAMARRANMQDFHYSSIWGLSRSSARDQARFFWKWDRYVPKRHERYARYLLKHIVPSQRWGFGRAKPKGWDLFFKGGWGVGTGRVNHQTAWIEHGRCRVAMAVQTEFSPGHTYGTQTIEGIAERLTDGIGRAYCGPRTGQGNAHVDVDPIVP